MNTFRKYVIITLSLSLFACVKCSGGKKQHGGVPMRHLLLSISWFPSNCQVNNVECNEKIWNIHGLIRCGPNITKKVYDEYKQYHFDPRAILDNETLYKKISETWRSRDTTKKAMELWVYQWLKHGRYFRDIPALKGETGYFTTILKMFDSLKTSELTQKLKVEEDIPIAIRDIENVIMETYGVDAFLVCQQMNENEDMFMEIRFCYNKSLKRINCSETTQKPNATCKKDFVRFPLNSTGECINEEQVTIDEAMRIAKEVEDEDIRIMETKLEKIWVRQRKYIEQKKEEAARSKEPKLAKNNKKTDEKTSKSSLPSAESRQLSSLKSTRERTPINSRGGSDRNNRDKSRREDSRERRRKHFFDTDYRPSQSSSSQPESRRHYSFRSRDYRRSPERSKEQFSRRKSRSKSRGRKESSRSKGSSKKYGSRSRSRSRSRQRRE